MDRLDSFCPSANWDAGQRDWVVLWEKGVQGLYSYYTSDCGPGPTMNIISNAGNNSLIFTLLAKCSSYTYIDIVMYSSGVEIYVYMILYEYHYFKWKKNITVEEKKFHNISWYDDNPENGLKNWISWIYEIVTYYLRLVEILICKTRIDFGNKKLKITGV